jgi:PAS domain S-box-containing protein
MSSIFFIFPVMRFAGAAGDFMKDRPTYDELRNRVAELEQKAAGEMRLEKALLESEKKYRELVQNANSIIIRLDIRGNLTFFNEFAQRFFGYPGDEILGKNSVGTIVPETDSAGQNLAVMIRRLIRFPEQFITNENENIRKNGQRVWIAWTNKAIRDENGAISEILCIGNDITERKAIQEALRESEEKFRNIVEALPMGVHMYRLEPDGRLIFTGANPGADAILGVSNTDFVGQTIEEAFPALVDTEVPERYRRVCEHGEPWQTEQIQYEDRHIKGAFEVYAFQTAPGKMATIFADITEKKMLAAQLQQADRMESLGTLAGGIAHDFNNLLMGVQGRTSLMMSETDAAHPHGEHLNEIEKYVKSAAELTKQLLGLARGGKYEVKTTDLNDLIDKNVSMFGRTKKEIRIHKKLQADLWPVDVDQGQLDQVFINIYVNAWQAMPAGGDLYIRTENITLDDRLGAPYGGKTGKHVKVTITDTGIGMDDEIIKRVFDPFFTTKEKERGTGLGLASAYGIVNNHEGIITASSVKGQGASFEILLPASSQKIAVVKTPGQEVLTGTETILLVDDEEVIADVGTRLLEKMGYAVVVARNGSEALKIYERGQNEIALVILDLIMPDMGGREVFDRLRKINPRAKVLLSSGYSRDGQASEILGRGCDGFIQKPFSLKALSEKIRELLGAAQPAESAAAGEVKRIHHQPQ